MPQAVTDKTGRVLAAFAAFFVAGVACAVAAPPPPTQVCPAGKSGEPCTFPWQAACADADANTGCLGDSPSRCDVDDASLLPAYDCQTCGCSGGDACVQTTPGSLCLSADVREGERPGPGIDDGLEDADYLSLFQQLHGPQALTQSEMLKRLDQRRADDPRRSIVVLGSDEGDLEQIVPSFFDGSFGVVRRQNDCATLSADAASLPPGAAVWVGAADRATDVTCLHPGVFARCEFSLATADPSPLSACASLAGLLPQTVVVLGTKAIANVDNALLRHAARAGRDQWLARFDAELGLFRSVFLGSVDASFAHPELDGTLRFLVDVEHDDVVFGLLQDSPDPQQLRTFRLMWVDATLQQFFSTHDITPSDCTFRVVDKDEVDVDCQKNGARVSGPVRLSTNDLSGLTLVTP